MEIKENLEKIIATKTLKQSLATTFATIVSGGLGVLFYIILARDLGPADFGVFAVTIAFLTLATDIANLGADTGVIRFVGKYSTDNLRVKKFLKLALVTKIISWIFVLLLGWFLAPIIAKDFFLKSELVNPLRLALVGVGGTLFYSFATSALQALQKYFTWSFLNIGSNTLRLVSLYLLLLIGALTLQSSLLVYMLIPFLGFSIALIFLPDFIFVKGELSEVKDFFHYNKWVALFILIAALSSRIDTFLVARFLSASSIGIYSAANQLTTVVPQLVFAIATVAAPKLASFTTKSQALSYLKKLQLLVGGLVLVGIISLPMGQFLVPVLFGNEYRQSVNVFMILFVAQLIFLFSLPIHQAIFYYFAKPFVFVVISVIHLGIMAFGGWVMIQNYGVLGASLTVLIGSISNLILPAVWVYTQFRENS